MTFQELLNFFVDNLAKEQSADRLLDEDALKEFKNDLLRNIINRINIAIVDNLPEEKLDEYEEVLAKSKEDQSEFLKKNLPELDKIIAKEFEEFRSLYIK